VDRLRRLVPSEHSFTSRLRSAAVAARVGVWLGVCFAIAFVTGLVSHYAQLADPPVALPTSPAWGYALTQGLHVATGTAAVPLLVVKLWSVFPRLFQRLPRGVGEAIRSAVERGSIAVLVAGSLLELGIGLMNVVQWYAWRFSFRATHYALAWIVVGALLVHVAVKLPVIVGALRSDVESDANDRPRATVPAGLSRRGLLRATWVAAGTAAVVVSPALSTLPGIGRLAALAPRSRRRGIPINRTAGQAAVVAAATSSGYRLVLVNGTKVVSLTAQDLLARELSTHTLPIACVEGWTALGTWTGVRLRVLLDEVEAPAGSDVRVTSLQEHGADRQTVLPANFVDDPRSLVALMLDGEPLSLDHGYPARLMAPDRPGALQTKWVARIEVV
jgi:DMSO/TMAO reductase YedYZ molybdopterin-dependent catalytic subunit